MRSEKDHLKIDIKDFSLYGINLKDPVECMFYSNFQSKIERMILEQDKDE